MKILIKLVALWLVLYPEMLHAQLHETRSYDLSPYEGPTVLTAQEKQKPSVLLSEKKYYEYVYKTDNELAQYLTVHRHIRINETAAVERYNKIYLPVNNPSDLISIKLRAVNSSGKITEMYKGDMKKTTEEGRDYLIMAVEGLEKDSELEYFYTLRQNVSYFLTNYLQSAVYTRSSQLQMITPSNLVMDYKAYNGNAIAFDTVYNSKRFLTIRVDSISELDPEEKYSYYDANKLRIESKLARNTTGKSGRLFTWSDAGTRFYDILHEEEKTASKDIQKLASTLGLKKLASHDEQIRAIENFMKTNINNKPDEKNPTIGNMLKKNYGGEKQITGLYVLMLEYLGIPHEVVITTNKSDAWFDPDFDTWNFLDEYLIYFPSTNMYIAPTNYLCRYGKTPYGLAGNNGLFIKKYTLGGVSNAVSSVRKIETTDDKSNFDNMNVNITFENQVTENRIKFSREFGGHSDNNIRAIYFYSNKDDREEIISDLVASTFKDTKSKSARMLNYDFDKDIINKPLRLEGTVITKHFIESAGENIVFAIGMVIGEQVELYQDHKRQNPISIDYPHSYERVLILTVPEGYTVKGQEKLNMNIVFEELGIGFVSEYKLEDNKLTVTVNEYYRQTEFPVTSYEEFRKVINAAANFNKIKLILTKS